MIPFRDNIPSRTYPIITISIIVINTLAFLYELSLGSSVEFLIERYGVIPLKTMDGTSYGVSALAIVVPYFTSIFLHGGWAHLIGNMWYLWIFGDNVEDRLGHMNYLLFYILCGLGAGIVHTIANVSSPIPSIGASGAIAGVLGAYFLSYPHARVLTLIPLFIFFQVIEIPALRLNAVEGLETTVVAFTTDIPAFGGQWGEPFLLGPGSIHVAHTLEERVPKRELLQAVELYTRVVQDLCKRESK